MDGACVCVSASVVFCIGSSPALHAEDWYFHDGHFCGEGMDVVLVGEMLGVEGPDDDCVHRYYSWDIWRW